MKLKHFSLVLILCTLQFDSFSQKYAIGLNTSFQWFTNDFYLNYKSVENPDLKVTYGDGSVKNVVEQYEFSPLWSVIPTFTYNVENPRNRGVGMEYSAGLGYSQVNLIIIDPEVVFYIPEGYAISSGDARQYDHSFGYVTIPLQVAKRFSDNRKSVFGALGFEAINYILVSKSAEEIIDGDHRVYEVNTGRLVATRDYLVSLGCSPEVGVALGRDRVFKISIVGRLGLMPFNIQKKEASVFDENQTYNGLKVKAYEETSALNFYYGLGVNFKYEFD